MASSMSKRSKHDRTMQRHLDRLYAELADGMREYMQRRKVAYYVERGYMVPVDKNGRTGKI